ncbi:hypothetical protein [Cellulomonas wangsupingiae]|uniref:Uncharacterized protein n=1 Tax=Cellulomonas wangsupingiae TaxID=2968085 RepID=A0ABY5K2Q1_9CELL|nr:hypothetical protein [Cellulomonas wangsupingiae]MCC2336002.1 hypothetical protein [Cellulomonas wangsupingiae]UUI64727.1 hypothetical protein NP075_16675 [Cellulomonas wangsupingiae]
MTEDQPQTPQDLPPHGGPAAPSVTSARLADRWEGDGWRAPLAAAVLALLTLPAVAMVLVALVVLAVQGQATWLVVAGAALVTTAFGALGTVVALRRGHPGLEHRLAVLAWVWGVLVVALGVALALTLDAPERVGVAVLLVLGGTYTVVLGLGLWGAAKLLPAPAAPDVPEDDSEARGTGDAPDVAPDRPAAAPRRTAPVGSPSAPVVQEEDPLAEWPEWGAGERPPGTAAGGSAPEPSTTTEPARPVGAPAAPRRTRPAPETVAEAEVVDPARADDARPVGRSTPPPRRSVTGGTRPEPEPTAPGPATERITRQDGDDGPPTQRLPPVGY